ncbi:Calcium/calmodulin-dependent 3',5'-cyclic nucleotide phosphodiesterase 1B, variant 2 [Perkinsus olseni]|uniref:Calcium/calmodulin-dependent 3',5'-cyclic nucleotide phosphodiesterase 1B, variant 2 n=1 Tax=Perkinsus olseni TaxID=32597 RepID=A0A7J6MER9_PEROL|nr:Calcium/calmodulin-dependent 3',5'-cyclic nucleotide phosphodiesterase 1B, variant 2 [Perkinsus olseni]
MSAESLSKKRLEEARSIAEHLARLVELADRHLSERPEEESPMKETYPTHARQDLESELYLLKTENDLLKQRCQKEGRVATLTEEMGELVRMQAATISRLEDELKNTREECRQLKQRLQLKSRKAKENSITQDNLTPRQKGMNGGGVSSLIENRETYNPGADQTCNVDSFVFVDFIPASCCARPQGVAERMLLHLKLMPGSPRSARQHPDGHGGPSGEKRTESNAEPIISSVAGQDRSLIAWGAMPSLSAQRYLHLSALVGGLGSITSLAIPFLLKDIMHLHPAETALLGAIASIPMLFKPAVAMASDNLPLLGYRRKPYLVLGSMSHSMSLIALAHLPAATGFVPIALIVLAMSTASAVVVTVKDTLMLQESSREQADGSHLISDMSILATGGSLSVSYLSGALLHVITCQSLIRFSAAGPLLLTGAAILMEEEPIHHFRSRTTLFRPPVVESVLSGAASLSGPLKLLTATILVPSYSTALFYYFTSPVLHFTPEIMGRLQVCGSLASVAAALVYKKYLSRRIMAHQLMKVVSWASVPVAASSLLLTIPAFEGRLNPIRVALFRHVLLEFGSVLTYLPITTQLAKSAPKEGSGVYFAIFSSSVEALNLASSVVSSEVTNVLGVTSGNFTNLTPLIVLCTACNTIPLLVTLNVDDGGNGDPAPGGGDEEPGSFLPSGAASEHVDRYEPTLAAFPRLRRSHIRSFDKRVGSPARLDTHPPGVGRNVFKHWSDRKTAKMMHELLLTDYNSELGDVDNEVLLSAKLWTKEALRATQQVITFGGNEYSALYLYKKPLDEFGATSSIFADFCAPSIPAYDTLSEIEAAKLWDGRLPRTGICFPACKAEGYDAAQSISLEDELSLDALPAGKALTMTLYAASGDSRPYCSQLGIDIEEHDLLCVEPEDGCETDSFRNEVCYSGQQKDHGAICISWGRVFLAILCSAPTQFVLDVLLLLIAISDSGYKSQLGEHDLADTAVVAASRKCTLQWLLLSVFVALVLVVSSDVFHTIKYGRPLSFLVFWFAVFVLDQLRNLAFQALIWFVLMRKLGRVRVEPDQNPPGSSLTTGSDGHQGEAHEPSPWQLLRGLTILVVDSRGFEFSVYGLVGVYALFILAALGIEEYVSEAVSDVFETVDTVFLVFFLLEIIMRLIAETGYWYLNDRWNLFDFVIVVGSFVAKIAAPGNAKSFTILRLFRLLRLVLALRKAGRSRKKRRGHHGADTALQFSSRVDRVMDILREVRETKGLSGPMRERVNWASEIINTNNLYTISVTAGKRGTSGGDGDDELAAIRQEINEWLALGSASAKTSTKTWRDNELEKFLAKKKAAAGAAADDSMTKVPLRSRTGVLLENILAGERPVIEPSDVSVQRLDLDPATARVIGYLSRSATSWTFNVFTLRYLLGHPESLPDPEAFDASYVPELDPSSKRPAEVLAVPKTAQRRRGTVFSLVAPRLSTRGSISGGVVSHSALAVKLSSLGKDVATGTLHRTFNTHAALGVFSDR